MRVFNKKASFEYELTSEKVEAGIVLKGIEAKAFRDGRINISQSHVKVIGGEIFLINIDVARKLLLHKNEILLLISKMKQKKLQIVATQMYNSKHRVKVELVLGVPKRKFDKKDSMKKKDVQRDIDRELKN